LSFAGKYGAVVDGKDQLSWELHATSPVLSGLLESYDVPSSVNEIPCIVSGEIRRQPEGSVVMTLDWRCVDSSLLTLEELLWLPRDGLGDLPCRYTRQCFVPGTQAAITSLRIGTVLSTRDVPSEALEWTPEAGQRVIDDRFGVRIGYQTDKDGHYPADALLKKQAEKLKTPEQKLPCAHRTSEVAIGVLEVGKPTTVSLSMHFETYPKEATVSFDVVIKNATGSKLEFGPIAADCGCLSPRIEARVLAPGESSILRGEFRIQDVGMNERSLRIPLVTDAGQKNLPEALHVILTATGQ
jgi:hypothetical protein